MAHLKSIDNLMHPADKRKAHYRKRTALLSDEQRLLESTQTSAHNRGLENTLTKADIIVPTHCPIFGTRLLPGKNVAEANRMSVDRIDNNFGYIPGNIRVISMRANRIKGDATAEELEQLAAYIRSYE